MKWLMLALVAPALARSESWSMASAVAAARAHSILATAADLKVGQAKGAYRQAQRALGPSLSGVGSYSDSDDPGTQLRDANQYGLHLGFDGLPWGSSWSIANVAERQWQEVTRQRDLDFLDLDHQVRLAYLGVLEARLNQEAIEKVRNKIKDELERYLPGFQAGGGPVLEQVKVQAFVAGLEGQLSQARLQSQVSEDEFRRLLNLPLDSSLNLESVSETSKDWENSSLGTNSPQAEALEATVRSQEASLQLSSLKRLPSFDLGADYGYSGQTWQDQSLGWGIKMGLSLPIWDWGRLSADKDQALAQWNLAKLRQEEGLRSSEIELRQMKRQASALQTDQERLAALLPRLEAAATAAARRYRLASLTLLDVTDIYSQWLQTLQAERAAHFGRLEALARIAQLTGKPFEADHAP